MRSGEIGSWINFKYEKLPTFYILCGIIGHSEKLSEKFFDYPNKNVEKIFGVWLCVPSRRPTNMSWECWLRLEFPMGCSGETMTAENISKEVVAFKNPSLYLMFTILIFTKIIQLDNKESWLGKFCFERKREAYSSSWRGQDQDCLMISDSKSLVSKYKPNFVFLVELKY